MRLLPPHLVLICLAAMAALRLWLPGLLIIAAPFNWLGAIPAAVGLGIAVAGAEHFRHVKTNIGTFDDPIQLVTGGLFRFSRNPMYLGFVLLLFGVAIMSAAASPLLVALAFAVTADRWYIPFEERAMRRAFGEPYEAYRRRVRRWV